MPDSRLHFDAAVFDLDGVITRTASLHAAAWKETFDPLLEARGQRAFDAARDYRAYVDGRPREEGVRAFLASRGIELVAGRIDDPPGLDSVWGLGNLKNERFRALLERQGVEVDASALACIRELRSRGVRLAVATSSRNASKVLTAAGLESLFDARVDGEEGARLGLAGKPSPDVFLESARRLGAAPQRTLVVEDAEAGVEAARAGDFGLVVAIDRGGRAAPLREHGADLVVFGLSELSVEEIDAWFEHRGERRPSALTAWRELEKRLRRHRPAVFLDYDGTLTPIVDRPENARLDPAMREALGALAAACPVVIVSGRGREDVARLVGIDTLIYAGSHGFDIAGPGGMRHEVDPGLRASVERAFRALSEGAAGVNGAIVEDKRFSVSLHYRLVEEAEIGRLEELVDRVARDEPKLRKGFGKKVFEVRPSLAWDKGHALVWILRTLGLGGPDVLPIYVGDDVTDEDAFREVRRRGIGILVSEAPRATAAEWWLQNPGEVGEWLRRVTTIAGGRT